MTKHPWRWQRVSRRIPFNQYPAMKRPLLICFLALPFLTVGCVRASFSAPDEPDSGTEPDSGAEPDSGLTSGPDGPDDVGVCSAPELCSLLPLNGTVCNPVCQTGACKWCSQKCSIAGDGTVGCSERSGDGKVGKSCTITNLGSLGIPRQSDTCGPGAICLGDFGSENTQCFSLCASDADCQGVACTPRPVAPPLTQDSPVYTAKVCDPPYTSCATTCCNPISGSGCLVGQTCYLVLNDSQTNDNRTICEDVTGIGNKQTFCNNSRECAVGWFCTDSGVCRQACDPKAPSSCLNGVQCNPYGNQFGYCP